MVRWSSAYSSWTPRVGDASGRTRPASSRNRRRHRSPRAGRRGAAQARSRARRLAAASSRRPAVRRARRRALLWRGRLVRHLQRADGVSHRAAGRARRRRGCGGCRLRGRPRDHKVGARSIPSGRPRLRMSPGGCLWRGRGMAWSAPQRRCSIVMPPAASSITRAPPQLLRRSRTGGPSRSASTLMRPNWCGRFWRTGCSSTSIPSPTATAASAGLLLPPLLRSKVQEAQFPLRSLRRSPPSRPQGL